MSLNVALTVEHLSARRGTRQVLTDVSFTARPSEILGVIGPNGAGKTTLFECVAGLLPFDGTVDNDLLFYVPDAIRPWPDQTVRWTLELTSRMFETTFDERCSTSLISVRSNTPPSARSRKGKRSGSTSPSAW
ncbi:MAG: type transport system ATP-binding protein [Thermoanaerobaculia bacterium]|jgi:ABC-type multidrug transport system ATPase subunit|nr:type transport system ATP-binding protein [Thermoanaerobaculia bacterium]